MSRYSVKDKSRHFKSQYYYLKITTTDRYIQFIKEDQDKITIDDFGDDTISS